MNKLEKIDRKDIQDITALTPMQEGMLFHYLKNPESDHYFEQLSLELSGKIDIDILEKAWNVCIESNEMLGTVFRWEKLEKPAQIILKKHQLQPVYYDFLDKDSSETGSRDNESDKKTWLDEIKAKDRKEKFDLRHVPFRVTLCRFDRDKYQMIISNHHILYDGWSNGIILKEFFQVYEALAKKNTRAFKPPVKVKFKEFVKWLQERDTPEQEKFWREYLRGFDARTELPRKRENSENSINTAGKYNVKFSWGTAEKAQQLVKKHKLTMASLLYGGWGLLLQKTNNCGDVVFGTTVSGRSAKIKGIEDMVGLFINTLPLRVSCSGDERAVEVLKRIDAMLLTREEYEGTSLAQIQTYSEIDNNSELFDSLVVLENYPIYDRLKEQKSTLVVQSYSMFEMTHYALTLQITLFDGIELSFNYNCHLLDESTIEKLVHDFITVTQGIIDDPNKEVSEIDILTEEEKNRILYEFNHRETPYPRGKPIQGLFEEQVEMLADRIAVVYQDYQLSYRELNDKSNRLAVRLRQRGVTGNTIVGVLMERSLEMIIGIFAILKAGGCYLPIDTGNPIERTRYLVEDSALKLVLTQGPLGNAIKNLSGVKVMDLLDLNLYRTRGSKMAAGISPAHLAYVIYTSGSTGMPKGVMIDHPSVTNLLFGLQEQYPFRETDTYLLKTSYVFDVSVTELFGWMLGGGRLAIIGQQEGKDLQEILNTIRRFFITHINFVPSMFKAFLEALNRENIVKLSPLKYIFLAGEALLPDLVKQFRQLNSDIILENIYGPTEAAVYASKYSLSQWKHSDYIPIGTPLPNVRLYILDQYDGLQPIGITGELCIGGIAVASGYLNRSELTCEKFKIINYKLKIKNGSGTLRVDLNAFGEREAHELHELHEKNNQKFLRGGPGGAVFTKRVPPGRRRQRIYKTGDLARWLPDGNVEFLGRKDHQVKIRGYRIELGEIEKKISHYPGHRIKDVVVLARKDKSGDQYLCAYITANPAGVFDKTPFMTAALKEYLSNELPDYMVPSYFVPMETMPLTPTGKLDRKALPTPNITGKETYTAPRNHMEQKLVKIWSKVLARNEEPLKIGIDDNFFQLGGHSLKAAILISKIHKELDVHIPLAEVFKRSTIRELASYINDTGESPFAGINPVEKKEYYELSSAQKRLYFLQQMDSNGTSYNMTIVLPLDHVGKDIDKVKLETTLKQLIARHESLRTLFRMMGETPVQLIHDQVEFEMMYDQVEVETDIEKMISNFVRPFDLAAAPLLRSGLIAMPDGSYTWIVDMHHIISDGTSAMILAEDFIWLYNGNSLEPLALHYKDFSHWQNRMFKSGKIKAQEEYWLDLYWDAAEIPRLQLPTDLKRPEVFTFTGKRYLFRLDREDARQFRALGIRHGGTLYMNILAALNTLFYRYSGQSDMIIGSGIAGRRHADVQKIIGMFVNTLAIRNYPDAEKTYESFLKEVTANSIKAFDNQDVQFEELVDKLNLERNPSRNPLFDISMVVQNFRKTGEGQEKGGKSHQVEILSLKDENLFDLDYRNTTSKFDMTFFIGEPGEDVSIMIEYYTGIFKEETVIRMARHLQNIIKAVIKEPTLRLKDIEIISPEERRQVLYDFNAASADFPLDKPVHMRFAEQVRKTPDNIALVYEKSTLTYQELEERVDQLVRYLHYDKGIQPEDRVGILLDKGIEIVVALLGTLKAGAAYVPMESSFPPERQKHIITDSHIGVVLSEKSHIKDLNRLQWECDCFHSYLCLDSDDVYREEEAEKNELMNRELWEHVGKTAEDEIAGGGWVSSYTGEPMAKQEMDEFGDNILKKLTPLLHQNMRVLEIGTASGITMFRIAPKVGLYYGTDLSSVIIEKNRERVRNEGQQNIKLACLAAHEIDQVEEKDFHLIIINSVIQSFHGHNYLRQVIARCIDLIGERGYLFIGDIMDQDLKEALTAEMIAFKQVHRDKNYPTKIDFSAELFISRGYWQDLAAQWKVIHKVEFSKKIYSIENELTKFRYDTMLTIDKKSLTQEQSIKPRRKYQEDRCVLGVGGYGECPSFSANVTPHHLAYVIYTSGTTGKPKGVMVEHSQVNNCLYWMQDEFQLTETDIVLQRTNLTFDPSVWEIFWPLVIGARIRIIEPDQRKDAGYLVHLMTMNEGSGVTIMYCPASLVTGMTYLLSSAPEKQTVKLPWLIIGAEPIQMDVVKEFYTFFTGKVVNTYGPTECTINNTYYHLHPGDPRSVVPIGKPVTNNHIYIFSHDLKPVPLLTAGELYIGGDSVARGYLNKPELSFEKFDQDFWDLQDYQDEKINKKFLQGGPGGAVFSKSAPPGRRRQKIYKTGDLARWWVDGNVEFLGRVDQQVKIRGYRIELGEIEKRLLQYDQIKEAVVVLHDGNHSKGLATEKFLCAYIVLADPDIPAIDNADLRAYLSGFLPDYMVPSYFIQIPRIPLTPGGKVDRKALPVPGGEVITSENNAPPRDHLERKLTDIWSEVLGRWGQASIGIDDNFFELGGHSLKATILTAMIHKELKVRVPMAEVFKRQTIRGLASYIRETGKQGHLSIEAVEKKEYYALSSAQKRLYVLQQMGTNLMGYNELSVLELEGELDRAKFEETFGKLIKRHENLRTALKLIADEPVQRIHDNVEFAIEYYNLPTDEENYKLQITNYKQIPNPKSQIPNKETGGHHSSFITHHSFIRPFDLSQAPLLRVELIKTGKDKHILMLDIHHIISDGISQGVFVKDFISLYQGEKLSPLPVQYKDFADWQTREKHKEAIKKQEVYWLGEFNGEIPVLNLPVDFVRPPVQDFEGSSVDFKFNPQTTTALKTLAREEDATLFMVLLAIYNIFLSKISSQEDIIIGTPVSGRRHSDLQPVMGMFVNTLALRNTPRGNQSFREFLRQLRERTLEAFENQEYQFEDLVEHSAVHRDASRNPIFDTMFALQNQEMSPLEIPVLKLKPLPFETSISKFDLALQVSETETHLELNFEYSTKLFKKETLQRFVAYFNQTVSRVLAAADKKISVIELLLETEKKQLLYDFNDTQREYPTDKTINELFASQVENRPDNIALEYEDQQLSYKELAEKVNRLVVLLRAKGVQSGVLAAVMMERSLEMIVGIFAILKAGGAYLPIVPDYPPERLNYILQDSSAQLLVTTSTLAREKGSLLDIDTVCLDRPLSISSVGANSHPSPSPFSSPPTSLAYVIYTSGSTGKPKGVMVDHGNLTNIVFSLFDRYPFSQTDIYLFKTSFLFDVSVSELFGWFPGGGKLSILKPGGEKDPQMILDTIVAAHITHINFVPSMFHAFVSLLNRRNIGKLSGLKYIFLAGEALGKELVEQFARFNTPVVLENLYGPTEATVYASGYCLEDWNGHDRIPIGKPLENAKIYILNQYDQLQPIGIGGELCICGSGVARGYLNQPQLTAEKFSLRRPGGTLFEKTAPPEPPRKNFLLGLKGLSLMLKGTGERIYSHMSYTSYMSYMSPIYRTGDLARWLPDGNIEYLGRIDQQVKIRGNRIELGEIENRLLQHEGIKEAVVVVREAKNQDKYLCAYMISDQEYAVGELREHLSQELPDYMIPSYFVRLQSIPLTASGKTDRKKLPEPGFISPETYIGPKDEIEEKLSVIWSEVLGIERGLISMDANFFQMGGHSLKATIMVSKIQKEFNVKLTLAEIFKMPFIRGLAGFIQQAAQHQFLSIKALEKREYYPLSSAQKRMYILQQVAPKSTVYNIPALMSITLEREELNQEKFTGIFTQLIKRHESLRTSFVMKGNHPVQRVHEADEIEFAIQYYDYNSATEDTEEENYNAPVQKKGRSRMTNYKQIPNSKSQIPNKETGGHHSSFITHHSFIRPFDLSQAPLLRVGLIKKEDQQHIYILMVDMHHIITDGISQGVFVKDFISLYQGEKSSPLPVQYKDFAGWQTREKHKEAIKKQEVYWQGEFNGEIPVLNLPVDFVRPPVQDFEGSSVDFKFNPQTTTALKTLAREEDATLFMVLLAIYNIFLSKISSQEDIIIGTPVSGRRYSDLQPVMGMFVNTLVLRNTPRGNQSFRGFLRQLRERTLEAFENQDYQFEDLVEHAVVQRDASRNPIFDTMFALQNQEMSPLEIPVLKLKPLPFETTISKFDLALQVSEKEKHLELTFEYSTKLFKKETLQRFVAYFNQTVSRVLADADKQISAIELLLETEKKQLLYDFNDTQREYPTDKTIDELFADQAANTPDNMAILFEDRQLTYSELAEKVNMLAGRLREKGVNPGGVAAIMVERSIEMMVGILAVLKAGGGYLPISPDYPPERIKYILKDSSVKLLLSLKPIEDKNIIGDGCQFYDIFDLKHIDIDLYPRDPGNLKGFNTSKDLAYVIYTSGSTGKPKGVMVEHGNLINILLALLERYPFTGSDTYLLKTPYVFDVSVTELFGWLITGGKLAIMKPGGEKDPQMILDTIAAQHITHINFVPSMFHVFVSILNRHNISKLSGLKYIFLAGEALGKEVVEMFTGLTPVVLENLYGPTEATIYASGYSLLDWNRHDDIPIGKPLENTRIYILNQYDQLQPIGIPGELCISGAGVARGYLNQPQLTAKKFSLRRPGGTLFEKTAPPGPPCKNFLLGLKETRERIYSHMPHMSYMSYMSYTSSIYRTGDLTRWLPDGNIEFLGRIDHQVKIRGNRIELGEIENRLLKHKEIKEAVVVVKEQKKQDKYLCAYMISDKEFEIHELRDFLSEELPDYMIPSYFVRLEEIPLTPNGKIDRKGLPEPEFIGGDTYIGPRNEIEEKLTAIWLGVLGIEKSIISIDANFFELGGHSLKATIMVAKIQKELSTTLSLAEIFKTPSIRGLAELITGASKQQSLCIPAAEKREYYVLSSAQKRLYTLQKTDPDSTGYNMPSVMILAGELHLQKFEETFRNLIQRHESLRTSFQVVNEEPVQKVHDKVEFEIEYYNNEEVEEKLFEGTKGLASLSIEPAARSSQPAASMINRFIRPFDLSGAPLFRVGLVKTDAAAYVLMIDMHHLVSDGISIGIMIREFMALYAKTELPILSLQYRDYSQWQFRQRGSERLQKQELFWLNEFKGELPLLNLPTDYDRQLAPGFEGSTIKFEIGAENTRQLKQLAEKHQATLYMVLLSVCYLLFAKISDQEDIVIGTLAEGRPYDEFQQMIGMFVNTLALRNYPNHEKTFTSLVKEVKTRVLAAFANQDYQFEDLVETVSPRRNMGRNPLFDVIFVFQNMDIPEVEIPGLKLLSYEYQPSTAKFDITIIGSESQGMLRFSFRYRTKLFKLETINRFIQHFKEIIASVAENPHDQLKDITITHDLDMAKTCNVQTEFVF